MGTDLFANAGILGILISFFVSFQVILFLLFLSAMSARNQAQDKARRMAEHRMNARLLRLNI